MKSGDYLSSQRLTVSTFGVKELNFCVRNGNRWILFAIITAMVIYSALAVYIRFLAFLGFSQAVGTIFFPEDLQLHSKLIRNQELFSYLFLKLVEIIDFSLSM